MSAVPTPAIRTRELTKHYEDTVAVEDVDLEVLQGEVFGFLGPNGAGKTTTIRLLVDLIRPTRGSAEILGLDSQTDTPAVRSRVGFLSGEAPLWPDRTGREVLDHVAALRGAPTDASAGLEVAQRLEASLDRPIGELSRGNRQKVALSAAFVGRPPLLILDEPTSGLDPLMQREVLDLVEAARDEGRTVFFSSHHLREVEQVADRVGVIRKGRLAAVEDVDELLSGGLRRVEVVLRERPPEGTLASVRGVHDVGWDGARARFRVEGSMDPLVKALAEHEVVDLRSEDPSLEEVFLAYYGPAEAPRGSNGGS